MLQKEQIPGKGHPNVPLSNGEGCGCHRSFHSTKMKQLTYGITMTPYIADMNRQITRMARLNREDLGSRSRFGWWHQTLRAAVACCLGASWELGAANMTDYFADRPTVTGTTATLTGNSTAARAEIGEPDHDGDRRYTVWGAWIAPGEGQVAIDTIGSSFNTVIAVYVGDTLTALAPVARNQNVESFTVSRVVFPTKKGATYSIAVDGENANAAGYGAVNVNIAFTPAAQPAAEVGTDNFSLRPTLSSGTAIGACNTRFAGIELFEPARVSERNQTVWWRWFAPGNGTAVIDTIDSDFNTVLTVYAGTNFSELSEVALSTDVPNGTRSRVSFQAKAGLEYQIMVDGQYANAVGYGNVLLHVTWAANALPGGVPGSNSFGKRGKLAGANAEGVAMNWLFDTESFEPDHGSARDKTAWWEWTAPATGPVRIRTEGSEINTHLAVYTGNSLSNLRLISVNNDVPNGTWSDVTFHAVRGETYCIMVDGFYGNMSGVGNIRLRVDQAVPPQDTLAIYPAVEVELPGLLGVLYQLQESSDLISWTDMGNVIQGDGDPIRVLTPARGAGKTFYRYQTVQ
jgi:hypothetical protein